MKTSKKSESNFIKVPKTTIEAVNKLLTDANGIDLTPLISDLGGIANPLIGLHVALLYKGLKPEICTKPREQCGCFYTFTHYSLILNRVEATETVTQKNFCFSLEEWLDMKLAE